MINAAIFILKKDMKKLIVVALVVLVNSLLAQTGKIRGTVIEDATGLPLIGCSVIIEGTTNGGITDFDGNYSITAAPGTYTLVSSYVSFATQKISDVVVKEGEVTIVKLRMKDQAITGETFELTAKQIRNNEAAISTIKRKSVNLVDGISAQTFKKNGDNTAAAALQRVTGVSIQGGKEVYVRGLGDRYSKTILNGVTVPGLDPDKNSVQVDIFPSNIIDNIIVYKSFSPDLPGDFTGGMVNIVTKDFPESKVLGASLSLGYNPGMNMQSDFLSYTGSPMDNFAMGAGDKALPVDPKSQPSKPFIFDAGDVYLENETKKFSREMSTIEKNSLLNSRVSFSLGNQIEKEKNTYGYTFALGYRKNYTYYSEAVINNFQKSDSTSKFALEALDYDRGRIGTEEVLWNGLLSGSVKREKSKYTLTAFHAQNGVKTASRLTQRATEFSENEAVLDKHILYYNQKSISNLLLAATHHPNKNLEIKTTVSPSLALNKEPDLRQTFFVVKDDTIYKLSAGEGGRVNRTYRNLNEVNINGMVDAKWSFKQWSGMDSYVKGGINYMYKNRNFDVVQYYFRDVGNNDYTGDPNDLFTDASLFSAATSQQTNKGIYVFGQIDSSNIYDASQTIIAGYLMNDLAIDSSLKVTYGARIEKAQMNYTGQRQTITDPNEDVFKNKQVLDELDVLPSVSLVYTVIKDLNLRANYSRTLARPSFKEKSGAQIYDAITQLTFLGNLDLEATNINNYDLRLEKYIGSKDIVSVSGFYKDFTNPIELVSYSAASPDNITPRNVGKATVVGVEFELRKNLAFLSDKVKNITIGGNITYAKSEVEMNDAEYNGRVLAARDGETIEKTREFQGQAPYMVNSFLSYSNFDKGIDVNLSYNVQGKSLAVVGISRIPDVYNKPFHNLSFKASKHLGEQKKHQVSFTVRNILGSKRERVYSSFRADDELFSSFNENRTFSVSYSFSIK